MSSEMPGAGARTGPLAGLLDFRRSPVRAAFGNLGWPILLKEIRSDFRKNRFFITHLVCLSVLAAGILWQVSVLSEGAKAEEVGRSLFNTFFAIQYLVVTVVFPAFSASALSEEKVLQTYDLLITTDLTPVEIVWGKFLASSIYCLIYIVATVPLLAVSLLFAGVSVWEIASAYLILVGLTLFIAMAGVFLSGCFRSTVRATIAMYVIAFGIQAYTLFEYWSVLEVKDVTWVRAIAGRNAGSLEEGVLSVLLGGFWFTWILAVAFVFLFLLAANRLRPRSDDHTSKIRILLFAIFVPTVGLCSYRGMGFALLVGMTSFWLFAIGIVFTAENPNLSARLRARFSRWAGIRFPLRIFVPGSFWGLVYSAALSILTAAFLALLLWRSLWRPAGGFDYRTALVTLPIYLFAFQAMGFFLSSAGFTPSYTALTVSFVAVISTLLPVIFKISGRPDGFFSFYYISPVTLWSSLDLEALRSLSDEPRYVLFGLPNIRVAQALYSLLGFLFLALGVRNCMRKGYPMLKLGRSR